MIHYFIEHLPGNRAQAWADLCDIDGTIEATYRVGSPAPRATVEARVWLRAA